MNNNSTLVNKISLLGLLALLAGTANGVIFALIFALSLSLTAAVIKVIYLKYDQFFKEKTGEIILWGIGLGISYFLYRLLPQIFDEQAAYFNYYFILIGVTPLVYAELKNRSLGSFIINHALFLDLMLAVSILRELLGQGSILNYQFFIEPPLSIANKASGAFLILAVIAFSYEAVIKKFGLEAKIENETEDKAESEV